MASPPSIPLLFLLLTLFIATCSSLTCTTQKLTTNKVYPNCLDLPFLNSFLHWTHDPSNSSLSVVFVATPPNPGGWVSWGLNPTGTGMVGTQALVAFKNNGVMAVKMLDIKSYSDFVPGKLSFDVWDLKAEDVGGVMRIFASMKVPDKAVTLNHVWQVGPSTTAGRLDKHGFAPANLNAKGKLSLNGEQSSTDTGAVDSRTKRKNFHGVLNAVSWGVLFPLGVIIARYMRTFPSADPAWFYLHITCQLSAYVIGVAGWGTGMKLGSESEGIQYSVHRNIGIALFSLCTLQLSALFIRPKKDHKYRYFWNIYHHSFGYTIIILGIINIYRGFDILNPEKKWKSTYSSVIIALGVIAFLLEVITWIVVFKRKSRNSTKPYDAYNNGQPLGI
ncbi:cytochrome b561 and DOMON domain-containing protein At3g25290-like [Gastrolobium bilobum]|uniref:cytochrome b561 and DOMON domain-containing protein At3g25290-like n=1 Tax=Gastrolobium bilobum TaxID=150636 RepID=UPI002AB24E35|nr:cytochrome b561 and DOMON domain-containing protein At3g25290-like [Gastrolobium bilobum]